MVRTVLASAILAGASALAHAQAPAQSASAPLIVTATVVSSCNVDVPRTAEASTFALMPVSVTCVKGGSMPRVQRPTEARRSEVRDAVLIIDF